MIRENAKLLLYLDKKMFYMITVTFVILYWNSPIDIIPEQFISGGISKLDDILVVLVAVSSILVRRKGWLVDDAIVPVVLNTDSDVADLEHRTAFSRPSQCDSSNADKSDSIGSVPSVHILSDTEADDLLGADGGELPPDQRESPRIGDTYEDADGEYIEQISEERRLFFEQFGICERTNELTAPEGSNFW